MAELLSIKERIARELVRVLDEVEGLGTVYRWDQRGLRDPATGLAVDADGKRLVLKNFDVMLLEGDETAAEGGEGNDAGDTGGGWTDKTLPFAVQVRTDQAEGLGGGAEADEAGGGGGGVGGGDDAITTSELHNRLLLELERALTADPGIHEGGLNGGGTRLAVDLRITATRQVPVAEGAAQAFTQLDGEITYCHLRTDPATGPGIEAEG